MSEDQKVSTYVVQQQAGTGVWHDIATVEVPARTKRLTVIELGLAEAGITPADGPVFVRVLDESSAREVAMVADVPAEPGWKVAGAKERVLGAGNLTQIHNPASA